jgi:hypothetical protein
MAAPRHRVRAAWIAAESGGYGVDPSADGSGYVHARAHVFDTPTNDRAIFEVDEATGRNRPTDVEAGPDGTSLTLTFAELGLSSAAGDGATPSSSDALTLLLNSAFGSAQAVTGEGVAAGSTSSTLNLDTNALAAGQLACSQGASTNSGRAQWRRVTGASSPYTVAPANWVATPDAADVAYGSLQWRDSTQGYSIAAVVQVEAAAGSTETYTLLGGRPTSIKKRTDAKGRTTWTVAMRFDSKTEDASAKSALPAATVQTLPGITGVLSPFWWGSTSYATKSVELEWSLGTVDDDSTAGVNGRAGIDVMSADLMVTIEPAFARSVWEADFNAATARELLVQFGAGVVAGGVLNSCALSVPRAKATAATIADDNGRPRHVVRFKALDNGASADLWRYARG